MVCAKCNLIDDLDKVTCSGFCRRIFHHGCVGSTSKTALKYCAKFPNIFWFCDDCRDVMVNRTMFPIIQNDDITVQQPSLKDEILINRRLIEDMVLKLNALDIRCADNTKNLTSITPPVIATLKAIPSCTYTAVADSSDSATSVCNGGDINNQSNGSTSDTSIDVPACSYSAAIPPALKESHVERVKNIKKTVKQRHTSAISGTSSLPDFGIKTVAPKFWLHLSRFSPSTTEEDILALANKCLGTNLYKVVKLIPKTKTLQDLEYICFKLGINDQLRVKALTAETWPIGVYIRPFLNRNFYPVASNIKARLPASTVNSPEM